MSDGPRETCSYCGGELKPDDLVLDGMHEGCFEEAEEEMDSDLEYDDYEED